MGIRAVPEKKLSAVGRGKNSGRGSVENTIFCQRGSASCELSGRYPLVYNYFSKG